jgi:hypothetical protein
MDGSYNEIDDQFVLIFLGYRRKGGHKQTAQPEPRRLFLH